MGDDGVQNCTSLDLAWPADESRNTPRAFPVGVLLAAERRVSAIRPRVVLGTVVGGVHHDSIIGHSQLLEFVEHLSNLFIVGDHAITVVVLAALAAVLVGQM